jgi:hypothetical protein
MQGIGLKLNGFKATGFLPKHKIFLMSTGYDIILKSKWGNNFS